MRLLTFLFFILSFSIAAKAQLDSSNQTYVVGIKTSPPFIFEGENGQMNGISIELLKELNKVFKKEIQFKKYELNDLLLAVENNEVDFSINPITVTEERLTKIDFSQPFFISHLSAVSRLNEKNPIIAFIKNLFSLKFLNSLLLLFVVIFIFGALVWYFERKHNQDFKNSANGLFNGVWFSAVTMTTVGYGDKSPKTKGGKIISMVWMFTAIIIISGFTASIAASLTVENLESNINNFLELKKRNIGTIEASSSFEYLTENNFSISDYSTIKDGLSAIAKDEIDAFVYDEPLLRFDLKKHSDAKELTVLPFTFNTQYYGLSFPKSSPLLDKINPELLRILKSPKWDKILEKHGLKK